MIIAPPAWSGRWGLDRALEIGERFQGVGYINRTDDGLFRPVVFWYGDESVPVNQVLGSTLPVRAPLPGTGPSSAPADGFTTSAPTKTSSAGDPLDVQAADPDAPFDDDNGTGTWIVWAVFWIVIAAGVVGGMAYLRRRARQS